MIGLETIFSVLGTIVATITGVYLRFYLKDRAERKRRDPIVHDINRCNRINEYIDQALDYLDADRILIFQFHNGDHFYTGHDIQKISAVFESSSQGISRERDNLSGLLLSNYNKFLKELIENQSYFRKDVTNINDTSLRNLLIPRGVKSIFSLPIYSIDSKLIAFITVEYVKKKKTNIEEEKDYMNEITDKLSGYLTE